MKEGVQRHQFVMLLQVGSHYKQHPQRNTQSMFFLLDGHLDRALEPNNPIHLMQQILRQCKKYKTQILTLPPSQYHAQVPTLNLSPMVVGPSTSTKAVPQTAGISSNTWEQWV